MHENKREKTGKATHENNFRSGSEEGTEESMTAHISECFFFSICMFFTIMMEKAKKRRVVLYRKYRNQTVDESLTEGWMNMASELVL